MERNSVKECRACSSLPAYSDPLLKIIEGDTDTEQWKSVRVLQQVFKRNLMECITFLEERKLSNSFCRPCAILVNEAIQKAEELEKVQKGFEVLQAQLGIGMLHPHGPSGPTAKLRLKLIGEGKYVSMASKTVKIPNTADNCGVSDKREGDPSISTNFTGEGEPVRSGDPVGNNNETIETIPVPPPPFEGTRESNRTNNNSQDANSITVTAQENGDPDEAMGDRENAENDDLMNEVGNIGDEHMDGENEAGEGRTENLNLDLDEPREDADDEEEADESSPPSSDDDDDEDYLPPSPSYSDSTTVIVFPEDEKGQEIYQDVQSGEHETPHDYRNYGNKDIVSKPKLGWPCPCVVCNLFCLNPREMSKHYKTKHPRGPYTCLECPSKLATRKDLMKHRRKVHNFPDSIMNRTSAEEVKLFAAETLPQLSPQLAPPPARPSPRYSQQSDTTVNNTTFSEKRDDRASSKTWKCSYCSMSYEIRKSLADHRRIKHPHTVKRMKKREATKYGCDLCNITFPDSMKSSYHDKYVHPNQTEWECRVCHEKFREKSRLRRHMNDKHKDVPRNNYNGDGNLQGQNP